VAKSRVTVSIDNQSTIGAFAIGSGATASGSVTDGKHPGLSLSLSLNSKLPQALAAYLEAIAAALRAGDTNFPSVPPGVSGSASCTR